MIKPRHKRLVVEPMDEEETSSIAIVRFDKFNTKSTGIEGKIKTRGKVLAVGDGCDHNNGAHIGDIVRFTPNGGLPINHEGRDLLILTENDLMGIEYEAA